MSQPTLHVHRAAPWRDPSLDAGQPCYQCGKPVPSIAPEPDPWAISPLGTIRGDDAPGITFRPLDRTDLARVLAILDGWTHDAQRGNALMSGDAATYSALIRSLAEARTIVERHMLAHPEPVATGPGDPELWTPGERAAAGWTPEPEPTCRHCGAPDLAPWDAADAGMAGDYCARCVDDAVLGAPCPACGNVPGDDDPCPSR